MVKNDFHVLTTFLNYSSSIQSKIYTANIIERIMKEFKNCLKTMGSLPSEEAVERRFICFQIWSTRRPRGFKEASLELHPMFEE
uniref:transposase n=1 Tax=Salimicrobium album TaxID=50717 RepID=UPI00115F7B63